MMSPQNGTSVGDRLLFFFFSKSWHVVIVVVGRLRAEKIKASSSCTRIIIFTEEGTYLEIVAYGLIDTLKESCFSEYENNSPQEIVRTVRTAG